MLIWNWFSRYLFSPRWWDNQCIMNWKNVVGSGCSLCGGSKVTLRKPPKTLHGIAGFHSEIWIWDPPNAEEEYKQFKRNIQLSIFESEWLAFHPIVYGSMEGEGSILEMCNFDMGLVGCLVEIASTCLLHFECSIPCWESWDCTWWS
jgi:hypothetical protein